MRLLETSGSHSARIIFRMMFSGICNVKSVDFFAKISP